MKKIVYGFSVLFLGLYACNNADRQPASSDSDIDAARNFIRSALDGDFDKAGLYMVNDSLNTEDLNAIRRLNERLDPNQKVKYREASIRIHETKQLNDSASVIYYSNSYKNKHDSLKVIKTGGKWLVDFKYIFRHPTDTLKP